MRKLKPLLLCSTFLFFLYNFQIGAAIQCYSGSQFSIIECPSLNCIKQTLGLDTVRYCDGTGTSSICSTYRIIEDCQNIPNLGLICCCSDQLCNSADISGKLNGLLILSSAFLFSAIYFWKFN